MASAAAWDVAELNKDQRRDAFDCGVEPLNLYLRQYARQNSERGIGRTYVALRSGEQLVRGYYTLATGSVEFARVPPELVKQLPKYPIPTAHLARLAVDKSEQGKGLGEFLLMDALARTLKVADQIGLYAIDVTAKDGKARSFYERYGFTSLVDEPLHLFISIKVAKKAFEAL